jgi:hypothetical protein
MGHGTKLRPTPGPSFSLNCYQDGEQFLYQLTHGLYNSCWAKQQSLAAASQYGSYLKQQFLQLQQPMQFPH